VTTALKAQVRGKPWYPHTQKASVNRGQNRCTEGRANHAAPDSQPYTVSSVAAAS
jgi:hypothetical protein